MWLATSVVEFSWGLSALSGHAMFIVLWLRRLMEYYYTERVEKGVVVLMIVFIDDVIMKVCAVIIY